MNKLSLILSLSFIFNNIFSVDNSYINNTNKAIQPQKASKKYQVKKFIKDHKKAILFTIGASIPLKHFLNTYNISSVRGESKEELKIIKYLLKKGAKLNLNEDFNTNLQLVLKLAQFHNRDDIVNYITNDLPRDQVKKETKRLLLTNKALNILLTNNKYKNSNISTDAIRRVFSYLRFKHIRNIINYEANQDINQEKSRCIIS